MNKADAARRQENIDELRRTYPGVDAEKLQDHLYRIALKVARNAEAICRSEDAVDQRPALREEILKVAKKLGVDLDFSISGDPRGFQLKLRLPTGRSNSFGGEVWGIA